MIFIIPERGGDIHVEPYVLTWTHRAPAVVGTEGVDFFDQYCAMFDTKNNADPRVPLSCSLLAKHNTTGSHCDMQKEGCKGDKADYGMGSSGIHNHFSSPSVSASPQDSKSRWLGKAPVVTDREPPSQNRFYRDEPEPTRRRRRVGAIVRSVGFGYCAEEGSHRQTRRLYFGADVAGGRGTGRRDCHQAIKQIAAAGSIW